MLYCTPLVHTSEVSECTRGSCQPPHQYPLLHRADALSGSTEVKNASTAVVRLMSELPGPPDGTGSESAASRASTTNIAWPESVI